MTPANQPTALSAPGLSDFEIGKILFESRLRKAWNFGRGNDLSQRMIDRTPWPKNPHGWNPDRPVDHELAMAQVKALRDAGVIP